MIDFSKISFVKENADYPRIQWTASIRLDSIAFLDRRYDGNADLEDKIKKRLKYELYRHIYGDLVKEITELKNLMFEYAPYHGGNSTTMHYQPYSLNESKIIEIINKIDELLKVPE